MNASRIDELLADTRRHLERVEPEQLAQELAAGALVVDIRPAADRDAEGPLPGALVVDRIVLEWRLDPTSPDRVAEADDPERRVILVCNDSYASSLAAETLRRIGLSRATDLVGGYRAWRAAEELRWGEEGGDRLAATPDSGPDVGVVEDSRVSPAAARDPQHAGTQR